MFSLLCDPRLLNFVLLGLYAANAARWAAHGSWPDALYWIGALAITLAVTFGFTRP